MTKYRKLKDYEGVDIDREDGLFRFACCDCGLVHTMAFVVEDKEIGVACRRENRATAQLRRHEFGNLQTRSVNGWTMLRTAVTKVLHNPKRSKASKTAAKLDLTQRPRS